MANSLAIVIRAKKLGVLIRDARLSAGKRIDEGAAAIGVSEGTFQSYEMGESSPSLPELELLAYFLNTPLEHFWGSQSISTGSLSARQIDLEQLMGIRQRMIGARLRKSRIETDLSLDELAELTAIPAKQLEGYEYGLSPVPLPNLEMLTEILNIPIKECFDKQGPVGQWANQQRLIQDFLILTPELQDFISRPVNRPYLELAQRLSEMSVDKLRAVAEGLLEITL
jgi:transcriptional regulator with XRE-family HTH domain